MNLAINKPLTDCDIKTIMNNKINVIMYSDLNNMNHIDEALKSYGQCIILYVFEKTDGMYNGHWVALKKHKNNNVLSYFDSFGTIPSQSLNEIPTKVQRLYKEDKCTLRRLLYESSYNIEYNEKVIQSNKSVLCGYFCCAFLLSNKSINEFQKYFSSNKEKNNKIVFYMITGKN